MLMPFGINLINRYHEQLTTICHKVVLKAMFNVSKYEMNTQYLAVQIKYIAC